MKKLMIFTDGSVNTKSKIGYGASLTLTDLDFPIDEIKKQVKLKRFEETSSTKLELQILIWTLTQIPLSDNKVTVYTDSQNIISLLGRRERLEENNFSSKKNELIKNHLLYQEFYRITDQFNCEFIKVSGHKASKKKNEIDQIFTLVDRASRNALRKDEIQ